MTEPPFYEQGASDLFGYPITAPEAPVPGTGECAFPACDCPGETPVCPDYETSNERARQGRIYGGQLCPVHHVEEPCPTCTAYIAAGL